MKYSTASATRTTSAEIRKPCTIGAAPDFFHFGEARVQSHGGERRDHEKFADPLERRRGRRGDHAHAAEHRHGEKAEDEPREDAPPPDLHRAAGRGGFLLPQVHTHKREHHHRRDDGERARELDHGGEVARALAEGIACGDDAGGIVDCRARPQAVGHVGKAHRAAHDGKEHDHRHIKEEGRGESVGDVAVLGVDDGRDRRDGAAAADAGARGDEVRELPVRPSARPMR